MKKYANSIIGVFLGAGLMAFLASCLNPIGFDPSALGAIKVEVSGEVDTRSSDYAVLWVINRTASVDVESLTVTRVDNPEGYPKVAAKPAHGSTYASYHPPTDLPYTVKIDYKPTSPPSSAYTAEQCTGSFTIPEKYMPKAGGTYPVYIYRAKDGGVILVEEEMTKVPDPADTENPPLPPSASAPTYPLIVRNVTADMNAEFVDFMFAGSTLSFEGPGAKDETLNYLEAGQYRVKAGLYRASAGPPATVETAEKNVPVITPNDSQSWHTLYMWIYKTKSGGYGTTTTWPPNPNDAADVTISDIAGAGNGLLKIVNKSETGSVLRKIRIDADEIVFGNDYNPSFTKDMEWMTVLSPGLHTVEFMPSSQDFYGINLTVQIKEGEVTTLSYFDQLANPDLPPLDDGYGSGLIKVVNNSTAVVERVVVKDTDNGKLSFYPYNRFTPPSPINFNKTGRVGVVGNVDFPITEGVHYLIMVELKLNGTGGYVLIERPAALKDQIVEIVINEQEIQGAHGSNVTVVNQTGGLAYPVEIVSVTLFNAAKPDDSSVFSGGIWTPAGAIKTGKKASFRVNHSIGMPITAVDSFKAAVTLDSANGQTGTVEKDVGGLYDIDQTITISAADLPALLTGSNAADITSFTLAGAAGTISGNSISVTVPYGTDITSKAPVIAVSPGAAVNPASGTARNFNSPVNYTVTAENGVTQKTYTVTVTVAPDSSGGGGGSGGGSGGSYVGTFRLEDFWVLGTNSAGEKVWVQANRGSGYASRGRDLFMPSGFVVTDTMEVKFTYQGYPTISTPSVQTFTNNQLSFGVSNAHNTVTPRQTIWYTIYLVWQ